MAKSKKIAAVELEEPNRGDTANKNYLLDECTKQGWGIEDIAGVIEYLETLTSEEISELQAASKTGDLSGLV